MLRPLPCKNPKRLVLLADSQDPESGAFLYRDIMAFKSESRSFDDIATYYRNSGFSRVTLTSRGEPESVQGAFVSANFFHLMGVGPALGRVFTPEEEAQRERVVVLSYGLWRRRFGGSQDAIGKAIQIDGMDSQIVGVMPPTFQFPARDQQFWAPLTTSRYWDDPALSTNFDPRHTRYFYERWQVIGRLSPRVTIAQAQTETNTIFRRSEPDFDSNRMPGITLTPLRVILSGNTRLALIVRSFLAVQAVDPGFEPEHVLTMNIILPSGPPEWRNAFYDAVLERVRALVGIQAAGEVDALFELGGVGNLGVRTIEGRPPEPKKQRTPLSWASIRGDYFQAMGTSLLRGRYFTLQDDPNSPLVAIIDESMARRYWPGQDPIGKRFKGQDPRGYNDDWLTVVGVVRDMRRSGLEKNPTPHVFEPYGQALDGDRTAALVVRTTDDSRGVAATLRAAVRELSTTAILSNVSTMEDQLAEQVSPRRFQTSLLGLFSGIAMVLAAGGIFGVMHYSVARRVHEIGVRAALGAQPQDILRLVLGQATKLVFYGITIGIFVALTLTRFMSSLLFGVGPTDVFTFFAVSVSLALVALAASYIPARRAMRVDPIVALRYE